MEPTNEEDSLAHAVIGAALEVHRILGPGFLESVYEEAIAVEFGLRDIEYDRQVRMLIPFKGHQVGEGRVDFVIGSRMLVDLKTVDSLAPIHTAKMISYLKAMRLNLGLLINFNVPMLRDGIKRVVVTKHVPI